jgi:hypothetical protein
MVKLIVGFVIIAAVAMLLVVAIAYWWVWLGLGAVGYAGYYAYAKQQEKANRV